MTSHASKAMSRGSHSTSTDVSLMDLNFRPSGVGRSVRKKTEEVRMSPCVMGRDRHDSTKPHGVDRQSWSLFKGSSGMLLTLRHHEN